MPHHCAVCGAVSSMCCGKCRSVYYCGKEHQKGHWTTHKRLCKQATPAFLNLQVCVMHPCRVPSDFPKNFNSRSSHFVEDGTMKLNRSYLFTWGVATCALLIIWGSHEVLMLHLSGWNAPGNPKDRENIDVLSSLPSDFEFQQGYILPGEYLNEELCSGMSTVISDMMNELLCDAPWKKRLVVLSGLKATHVVRASVGQHQLEVFTNPLVSNCTPS